MLNVSAVVESLGQLLLHADAGAMNRCERMYANQWRSAPFPASYLDAETLHAFGADLRFQAAVNLVGPQPATEDEWVLDGWFERVEEAVTGIPLQLTDSTLLVRLVNYKGEEEGFAFYDKARDLPVFVSKDYSADYFNA